MRNFSFKTQIMNKLDFKKKVLQKARERQNEIINDFQTRIDELKAGRTKLNEEQYTSDQQASDSSDNELINNLKVQINFLEEEMDLLKRMEVGDKEHDHVVIGSVVKTDRQTFFPSVSIEYFDVDGHELFGISTKAPLYEVMKGKKAGDEFSYKNERYRVEEIY